MANFTEGLINAPGNFTTLLEPFLFANTVSDGWFGIMMSIASFIIPLMLYYNQDKATGLLVGSFVGLLVSVLLASVGLLSGIISAVYFVIFGIIITYFVQSDR